MALDKLVDSTELDSGLTTIANAIRTKGGTSAQLSFPSGMAQAVADLPSGGSLPSVISKIDGGSFTLASDVRCDQTPISHNLGEIPKGFVMWTTELDAYETQIKSMLIKSVFDSRPFNSNETTTRYGINSLVERVQEGITATYTRTMGSPEESLNMANSTRIRMNYDNRRYKAGVTYNWIAWA